MRKRFTRHHRRRGALLWLAMLAVALSAGVISYSGFVRLRGLVGALSVDYVVIDLAHGGYRVSPALASGVESFSSMMTRLKPYAAITGTYYDPEHRPLGDLVIDGKIVCRGSQRQGIGFTSGGQVRFYERKGRSRIDWTGCYSGIACGPRLVRRGKKDIDVKRDGFSLAAETNVASRCAVGVTADGKMILCTVAEPITLDTLADVMLELGAREAVNMDGGRMCALYGDGRCHAEPMSPINNVLAVYKRK